MLWESFRKRSATLALLVFVLLLSAAWAQKETVLYNFCTTTGCTDGNDPYSGVVLDQQGNLYGTTVIGGAYTGCQQGTPCGNLFKLTPAGQETVLYNFCAESNCTDGALPFGLAMDGNGSLYGTTEIGGSNNNGCETGAGCGVLFQFTSSGKYTVLYTFCAQSNCADGAEPRAGVVLDQQGNLYGTTIIGGAHGDGVVFKLTPAGNYTVLYSFCSESSCADGALPSAAVVLDQQGNLYGTTIIGGAHGDGIVFKLTPAGNYTVLYSFCSESNCVDGSQPYAGLVLDQQGNLYGTTAYPAGVIFKLTPAGQETVLHTFCSESNCADGENPFAGVTLDQQGNMYGTTSLGGNHGGGVVFKLNPAGKYTVLHNFCTESNCADGNGPTASLVLDSKGNLYSTTVNGGSTGLGVVFKLIPGD